MSRKINESDICHIMIFDNIPSDNGSITSFDDSDADETYTPSTKNSNLIGEESSNSSSDDVEILNLDNNITYILPSSC